MDREAAHDYFRFADRPIGNKTSSGGYRCQRCRNHDVDVARKGHVDRCPFRACRCAQCVLVERRTDTHRLLKQKVTISGGMKQAAGHGLDKRKPLALVCALTTAIDRVQGHRGLLVGKKHKGCKRILLCAKCSKHHIYSPLKNHKQACPYRLCKCPMCHLVDDYRSILKDQIRTRRIQSRQRATGHYSDHSTPLSSPTERCHTETESSAPALPTASPLYKIRKSVIVAASSLLEPVKPEPMITFDNFRIDNKADSMLWLSHLAVLSGLWQGLGPTAVNVPFPFPLLDAMTPYLQELNIQNMV